MTTTFETYENMLNTYWKKRNKNTAAKAIFDYLYNIVYHESRLPF